MHFTVSLILSFLYYRMLICFHFKKLLYHEVLLLGDVSWVGLVCENLLNFMLMKDVLSYKYFNKKYKTY